MLRPWRGHIPGPFNKDMCPDISQRISVAPREHGPNPNIAGLGVSASEKIQRSDSRGLMSFDFVHAVFLFDSIHL